MLPDIETDAKQYSTLLGIYAKCEVGDHGERHMPSSEVNGGIARAVACAARPLRRMVVPLLP